MNRMQSLCAVGSVLAVVGCAKDPDSIAPAYVSEVNYQNFSCTQLAQEEARLSQAYQTAAAQQKKARDNDVAGVILIGLPVSSLSGDNIAPQIANLKGQMEAVQKTRIAKGC